MTIYKFKPTTALNKIQSLLSNDSKDFVIQGGQGAGKTISILMILIDLCHRSKDKRVSIVSDELSKMKRTVIRDFLDIMKDWNVWNYGTWNKTESIFMFKNGSFIEFLGLDVHDVGKGMRREVVYFNEANKLKLESYRQVASRSKINIIDFNPDGLFWGHDLITKKNYLELTFLDNEYLPKEEVNSILEYKKKGFDIDGNLINEYWANIWNVYGLGKVGSVEGRIYYWNKIPLQEYQQIKRPVYYGVDWGNVDPFAVIEVKYSDGCLYCRQINYQSENKIRQTLTTSQIANIDGQEDGLVPYLFKQWGIKYDSLIVCDNNRPTKILSLRNNGWEYAVGVGGKSKLIDRIGALQNLKIFYTDDSKDIDFEQMNYCYGKDRNGNSLESPMDLNNHTIDAISYIVQKLFDEGIINSL